jgi:hypothetical protein
VKHESLNAHEMARQTTENAVQTQIRLALERYRSKADGEMVVEHACHAPDKCGGPPAYLLKSSWL